ncbi:MAG: hypothetical protein WA962_07785 [Ornithinimicrobium sp.]
MSSRSWVTRTSHISVLSLLAALWAGSTGHYALVAIFAATTLVLWITAAARGLRRASAVIDGADRMLEDGRRPKAQTESAPI